MSSKGGTLKNRIDRNLFRWRRATGVVLAAALATLILPGAVSPVHSTGTTTDGPASEDGSSYRSASEHWEQARERVMTDTTWKSWLIEETNRLNDWVSVPRDDLLSTAGWIHDFHDPKTGRFIGWIPTMNCADFLQDSRVQRACFALRRHHNMRMMQSAARLSLLTGDRSFADWSVQQLDLYVDIYAKQAAEMAPGLPVLFVQSLDEANMIPLLTDTVRLLRKSGLVSSEQARRWCHQLLQPVAAGLMASQKDVHNVAVWLSVSIAIVGMECANEALLSYASSGPWSVNHLLETGVSADGFWLELSLSYQNYVVTALNELLLAAALRGHPKEFAFAAKQAAALLLSPYEVQFGDGDGPTINDSNRYTVIPDDALLLAVRRTLPTDRGVRLAAEEHGWELLLDPPMLHERLLPAPESLRPGGRHIPGLKSLYLHKARWFALLRVGQGAPFHAHQDALSLELKYQDTWLLRNSATPAYGSLAHQKFYKLAAAHSTPLVNGKGVSNWFSEPTRTAGRANGIDGEFRVFQQRATVRRRVTVVGKGVEDHFNFTPTDVTTESVGALYHTDCAIAHAPSGSSPSALPPTPGFEYLSPLLEWQVGSRSWRVGLDCEFRRFNLTITGSSAFRVTLATSPALQPDRDRTALIVDMPSGTIAWIKSRFDPLATTVGQKK